MSSPDKPKLRLYNTLTRAKEDFVPIDPANVRMYVCGPTVYDYAHIGNARPVIVFDVLYRLLRHLAKQGVWDGAKGETKVTYVRNITDVDDKINARAAERGISIRELTEQTNNIFQEDVKALGCLEPDVQPRATEHIVEMIAIIERLIAQGNAYAADGHALFSVPSMKDYGKLSRRPLDEMIAGARVDVAPYKKGDMDFVLWKPSKESEPGWDSPWGRGRPGWHIECSAMSWKHLGETFDIHGGGIDLVFPHHENEIAQSRCAFNHDVMANVWMHNGFLQVEGEKMSKSLGNFVTIHELLHTEKFGGRAWPGDVLRLVMLSSHYRQPIDWTERSCNLALEELEEWSSLGGWYFEQDAEVSAKVVEALADDLNSPAAIAALRQLFQSAKHGDTEEKVKFGATCRFFGFRKLAQGGLFESGASGMGEFPREVLFENLPHLNSLRAAIANDATMDKIENIKARVHRSGVDLEIDPKSKHMTLMGKDEGFEQKVDTLIAARLEARKNKNWAESDRIREELLAMGIQLKDGKDPATGEPITTWEVKR